MAALNPLTHETPGLLADVLAIDPALRGEERLQSILHIWLRRYFTGLPFNTLAAGGGVESRTLTKCLLKYQETDLPRGPQNPVLHLIMPDRQRIRRDHTPDMRGTEHDWTIDMLIRVPSTLSNTEMQGISAEDIAVQVGDEAAWLLESSEREALVEAGVTRVRLERPSSLIASGDWKMRMLVFSCRTRQDQARRTF